MAGLYKLSEAEIGLLSASAASPNTFFSYFFRPEGSDRAFQLDYDFTDEGKWQEMMCMATQTFIVAICGVGTGKTLGVGMSAVYHAVMTPGFKFMNVANEAWQSQQMFDMIIEQAEDTPFAKMIKPVSRPYYKIDIAYKLGRRTVRSSLQFMSLGEKKNATNIFTWRGDWINIDEGWLIDNLAEVVSNLQTRLTGNTRDLRPYLGRMSITSNPGENPELWQFYDQAEADTEEGLVINTDTATNRNVNEKQKAQMLKRLDKDQQERFLHGRRPEGRGKYFSNQIVAACEDKALSEVAKRHVEAGTEGWIVESLPHLGVWWYQSPPRSGRLYGLWGDPGILAAPARNAPVVQVWDITEPFNRSFLTAMWWGNGGNSILPWIDKMLEWIQLYKPMLAGVDNTGPQKNTAELINMEYISGKKLSIEAIQGLDFSGSKRMTMLASLRLDLTARRMAWPDMCRGLSIQAKNYDPTLDRTPASKLAQDLVATASMASFHIRAHYGVADDGEAEESAVTNVASIYALRHSREGHAKRIQHTPSRR